MQIIGHKNFYESQNEEALRAHFFKIYKSILEKQNFEELTGNRPSLKKCPRCHGVKKYMKNCNVCKGKGFVEEK